MRNHHIALAGLQAGCRRLLARPSPDHRRKCFPFIPSRPASSPPLKPRPPLFPFLLSTTSLTPADPTSIILSAEPDSIFSPLSHFLLDHPIYSYGATIVFITIVLRTAFSLPAVFWARNRALRAKSIVLPEMKKINRELAIKLVPECRRKNLGYDVYRAELKRQVSRGACPPLRSRVRRS